uniref:Uncharacterized protein n=1 Tax=Gallus gallus TaxID=9031 RepID=A0A8V0X1M3_CHICK
MKTKLFILTIFFLVDFKHCWISNPSSVLRYWHVCLQDECNKPGKTSFVVTERDVCAVCRNGVLFGAAVIETKYCEWDIFAWKHRHPRFLGILHRSVACRSWPGLSRFYFICQRSIRWRCGIWCVMSSVLPYSPAAAECSRNEHCAPCVDSQYALIPVQLWLSPSQLSFHSHFLLLLSFIFAAK